MANPPYSASIIILREHADGFTVDLYHYADMPETAMVPPRGPIQHLLTGVKPGDLPVTTNVSTRGVGGKAALVTAFSQFLNAKYPDSPA